MQLAHAYETRLQLKQCKLRMRASHTWAQVEHTEVARECATNAYKWDARNSHAHVRHADTNGTHASYWREQVTRKLKWDTRKSRMSVHGMNEYNWNMRKLRVRKTHACKTRLQLGRRKLWVRASCGCEQVTHERKWDTRKLRMNAQQTITGGTHATRTHVWDTRIQLERTQVTDASKSNVNSSGTRGCHCRQRVARVQIRRAWDREKKWKRQSQTQWGQMHASKPWCSSMNRYRGHERDHGIMALLLTSGTSRGRCHRARQDKWDHTELKHRWWHGGAITDMINTQQCKSTTVR